MDSSSNSTFDYIILGGGTAGLTLASRLTENKSLTVLVLEAGEDRSNDIKVLAPGFFTSQYGDPSYDWNFKSKHSGNRGIFYIRGKQLGGSSAVNFMYWTHPSRKDIDNWGALGNSGWSWDEFNPFMKKSESYIVPTKALESELQTRYGLAPNFPEHRTFFNGDPRDGLALGGYTNLINVNWEDHTRSYVTTTYYRSAATRPNLTVITSALIDKLILEHTNGAVFGRGVKWTKGGQTYTASAKREFILSAGAIGTPNILERSGIGNRDRLSSHGIDTVVHNPGVGENMQDHLYVPLGRRVKPGIPTADDLRNETILKAVIEQYVANHTGPLSVGGTSSALLSLAQLGSSIEHFNVPDTQQLRSSNVGLAAQYNLLMSDLASEAITQEAPVLAGWSVQHSAEPTKYFSTSSEGNFLTILGVLEHPFSRGSVHITSADPEVYPTIDPKYLSNELDLDLLSVIALHMNKLVQIAPLSDLLERNGTVPQPGHPQITEDNVRDWIRQSLHTENHASGTCSMMPREIGGVVNSRFQVYGVENLRVVDASVIPLIPRANIQSVVYGIAERAAE